jgi:hypothetical protein
MIVKFKVLIYPTLKNEFSISDINRTSIILTPDELQHYKEFGYILRKYTSKDINRFWFFSEMEYHGTKNYVSWLTSNKNKIKELVNQHKEQIETDINLYKDYDNFYY